MSIKNNALLLIEFQNEWLSPNGKLHHLFENKTQFSHSIENAKKVLEAARKTNIRIIHSGLAFTSTYQELGIAQHGLRNVIPKNKTFLRDSNASKFTPPFAPLENEFATQGRVGASAFSASNLDSYLRNNQIENLFIMGYALHVCVESTFRAAHDLGYAVTVIDDACSAFTAEQQKYFCDEIAHHFGICIKSAEFIENLDS